MGAGHDHGGAARAGARHRKPLAIAFGLTAAVFVVEATAGFALGSLALLSDAGHMLTDVMGLGMALAAIGAADRMARRQREHGRRGQHTFGVYRLEILAALANSVLLVGVAGWVLWEAVSRIDDPHTVDGGPMLAVAALGLAVNVAAALLLRRGANESINVEGAYLEVVADLIGSVGVLIGAGLIAAFGWTWVDPAVGAAIGLWILPRTLRLGRRAVRILLQVAPDHIDPDQVAADLAALPGVLDVHDVHVWTLTSDMESATAHLTVEAGADLGAVLTQAQGRLRDGFGIDHATLQVEPEGTGDCEELEW